MRAEYVLRTVKIDEKGVETVELVECESNEAFLLLDSLLEDGCGENIRRVEATVYVLGECCFDKVIAESK